MVITENVERQTALAMEAADILPKRALSGPGDGHVGLAFQIVGDEIGRAQQVQIPTLAGVPKFLTRGELTYRPVEVHLRMAVTRLCDERQRLVYVLHVCADAETTPLLCLTGLSAFHACPVWKFSGCCYIEIGGEAPSESDLGRWADSFMRLVAAAKICSGHWEIVKSAASDLTTETVPTYAEVMTKGLERLPGH